MNPKLDRTAREIERAKGRIAELQALLPGLEKQKTDLENTEIVRLIRSANIDLRDLKAILPGIKAGTAALPAQGGGEISKTEESQIAKV
jgi:hypothetical protein